MPNRDLLKQARDAIAILARVSRPPFNNADRILEAIAAELAKPAEPSLVSAYDEAADVLYVGSPDKPTRNVDADGIVFRYDEATGALVGITIIDYMHRQARAKPAGPAQPVAWHAPGLGEVHSHDHLSIIVCTTDNGNGEHVIDDALASRVCAALNESDRLRAEVADHIRRSDSMESELEGLRRELDRAINDADRAIEHARRVDGREREALRAEVERLRGLLKQFREVMPSPREITYRRADGELCRVSECPQCYERDGHAPDCFQARVDAALRGTEG